MPSRRGFTIIELVVVIGIVLVLIGLVLPSLRRTREQARDTRELSVARANIAAVAIYAANYQDYFPTGGTTFVHASGSWAGCLLASGVIKSLGELNADMSNSFSYVAFVDPSGVRRGEVVPAELTRFSPQKLGSVRYPSDKGLIWPILRKNQPAVETWCCGPDSATGAIAFADGSASMHRWMDFTGPSGVVVEYWAGMPVISTWDGIWGRDRQ
ncbi:MAG: prepilin-type N-terminal cleavage/methylation domain-containing protein [Phycisphaerales bacterium]|nr:prepilin-type N-terminal cleavage/methylation domain-containing protein [Phycisphaerales bacterium]